MIANHISKFLVFKILKPNSCREMKQDKVLCLSPPQGKLNNYEIYKTRLVSLAMPAWGMKAGRSGASHLASHLA